MEGFETSGQFNYPLKGGAISEVSLMFNCKNSCNGLRIIIDPTVLLC